MCGIAGWVDYQRNLQYEATIMDKLAQTLAPRGPDAQGAWSSPECSIVHRRLIVIDPENGKQPMQAIHKGKTYTITYNGELYNTEQIRQELVKLGFTFLGHSDTEVLLKAYIAWGEECLEHFNGIYAFGIWNDTDKVLFMARDRIGVKPLFFHKYENGIIFGSEIKTLLAHPYVTPTVKKEGIAQVILLGPGRKQGSGVFNDIHELKPAQYAYLSKDGFTVKTYWRMKARPHFENEHETAEHVRWLLEDAVTKQLVSDVPLCCFLSGGLDSSIICAIAAEEYRKKGKVLNTFSVDYRGNREHFQSSAFQPDEDFPWTIKMSNYLKTHHTNVTLDTQLLVDALIPATNARDLPGMADVDSSLYLFCKELKGKFAVGLSGECSDELFGGYPWYHKEEILYGKGFPWSRATHERFDLLREGLLGDLDPGEYIDEACQSTISTTDYLDSDSLKDRRMREMFLLNFNWFMQVLLDRKDRMTMANGLEVRVPFCDHRIAEYAYNIPWEIKAYQGREKGIVRYTVQDLLPHDVVWRKKSPYPKTHNPMYFNAVVERFRQILNHPNNRITEILDHKKLQNLIDSAGSSFKNNWYGQLMAAPQLFAYLIQLEHWLTINHVILQ